MICQGIRKYDVVDIFGIVFEMRKERVWMVQTEQQYICIHQVSTQLVFILKPILMLLPMLMLVPKLMSMLMPMPMLQSVAILTVVSQCLLAVLEGKEHDERHERQLHDNEAFEDDEGIAESGM